MEAFRSPPEARLSVAASTRSCGRPENAPAATPASPPVQGSPVSLNRRPSQGGRCRREGASGVTPPRRGPAKRGSYPVDRGQQAGCLCSASGTRRHACSGSWGDDRQEPRPTVEQELDKGWTSPSGANKNGGGRRNGPKFNLTWRTCTDRACTGPGQGVQPRDKKQRHDPPIGSPPRSDPLTA
jgi:hypothetical protein